MLRSFPVPTAARRLWERVPAHRRLPVAVYISCQVVLLGWWAACFPGLMSYDSVAYVWQVTTDHWLGNHSVLYNCFVWLSIQLTGDLWLLTLVQTIAMSAVLAYTCTALREFGARAKWTAPLAVALCVLPATGSLIVFVWKDAAFTVTAVLAFAASLRLVARRLRGEGAVRDRAFRRDMGLLLVGLLGISLFRNNSILVVVFAFPFLLWALKRMRKWITAVTAVTVAVYAALQFVIYPAVGIVMPRTDQVYAFNYADIAVAYGKAPGTFTTADKQLLAKVAPLSHWGGTGSNCYSVDDTLSKPFDQAAAREYNSQLLDLWFKVVKRTPQYVAYGHICRAQISWAIWPGPADVAANTHIAGFDIPKNLYGWVDWNPEIRHSPYRPELASRPLSHTLHSAASFWYKISTVGQLQWLLWRGALWCYLLYGIAIAYAVRRKAPAAFGMVAITVGLQLSVFAANPAQLARYMIPPMFLGILSLSLLPVVRHRLAAAPTGADKDGDSAESLTEHQAHGGEAALVES